MTPSFILILILTFAFGYLNGVNGAGSVIATVISSRALKPNTALALAIISMCIGPFVFGIAVAGTISVDLISLNAVTTPVIIAALGGAVGWIGLSTFLRIPCSTTQAFIGSLLGAAWAGFGIQAIVAPGVVKTLLALFLSPLLGIAAGYVIVKVVRRFGTWVSPSINGWFKAGQVVLSSLVAVSFGSNDGQKLMGIVALGSMATTHSDFAIPYWSAAFAALAMAAGTFVGSRRVVHTLGNRLYNVQPIHGFGAQTASCMVLVSSSLLGSPISGSQVIASAIVGAGSAERLRKVRWGIFRQILNAWVLTLPVSALVGAILYEIMARFIV
ncbi:MAG: inorganic phosphate transporter [Anaerolineae bacterium]|nr:inorganic phosphate transporter [Anaerolineae bacterium]